MNSEEALERRIRRSIIGVIITTWAVGILIGLGAGKAIWKEEKVPPHGSLINTNHEVLLPSTQHLIARLAKIDRDLDQMLVWASNANAAVRTGLEWWPLWDGHKDTNEWLTWTNIELVITNTYYNYTMTFPDFPRGSGKWGGQATNSP